MKVVQIFIVTDQSLKGFEDQIASNKHLYDKDRVVLVTHFHPTPPHPALLPYLLVHMCCPSILVSRLKTAWPLSIEDNAAASRGHTMSKIT